jgi:hypothetical protein
MKDIRLVKIKTWDQMEKEFGLTGSGSINCTIVFTEEMEEDLPKNRIIVLENDEWRYISKTYDKRYWICDEIIKEELSRKDYPQYFI